MFPDKSDHGVTVNRQNAGDVVSFTSILYEVDELSHSVINGKSKNVRGSVNGS